jgi:hypothetical protein
MKALRLTLFTAMLFASRDAFAQGQFFFNNYLPPDINARFVLSSDPRDGSASSIGPGWQVQLLGGPRGIGGQLIPLDPPSTTFRTASPATYGYVNPVTVTVPNVPTGAAADVWLKVIDPNGTSYIQRIFSVTLGGGVVPPPNLPMGTSPLVVDITFIPEPSPLVLFGCAGVLGCLFSFRGRKRAFTTAN